MRRFKEIIPKVLAGITSVIIAVVLLIIMAGVVQVLSLGIDWVFNNTNTTTEFIETVKLTGFFVGLCALTDGVRKMIRY